MPLFRLALQRKPPSVARRYPHGGRRRMALVSLMYLATFVHKNF
ncbi:hypothetical protein HNP40_000091 [Mycobacteroides chelonae]|nr:hypothetical protein [Mycobacteroides chelonae]